MTSLHWRNPKTDPPEVTGTILVMLHDFRPVLVEAGDDTFFYTDGETEIEPASPCEWQAWAEIPLPGMDDELEGKEAA